MSSKKLGFFEIGWKSLPQYLQQSARYMIDKYASEAFIDSHITPHMFRHVFVMLLLEEDVGIRYI